jgi:hypothetical protein
MERKYSVLRTIGIIYKLLGIIAAGLTVLTVLGLCATSLFGGMLGSGFSQDFGGAVGNLFGGVIGGLIGSVIALIYGGGAAVTLYAFGEGIDLLISLEENTRQTAMVLQQRQS